MPRFRFMTCCRCMQRPRSGDPSALTCTSVEAGRSPSKNSSRAQDFPVLLDVDDEGGHFHHVGNCAARCFDEVLDLGEDDFRLSVFPLAFDRYPILRTRNLRGDKQEIAGMDRIRPPFGRGFRNMRAVDPDFRYEALRISAGTNGSWLFSSDGVEFSISSLLISLLSMTSP